MEDDGDGMPKSKSRKVNGYVKAVVALEAVTKKRDERYERYVRALDVRRDRLAAEVAALRRALTGGQSAEAGWILGARTTIATIKDGGVRYAVSRPASPRGAASPGRAVGSRGRALARGGLVSAQHAPQPLGVVEPQACLLRRAEIGADRRPSRRRIGDPR